MAEAPFANTTAAVVNARNTSMIAAAPIARVAPSRRLWIEISIGRPSAGSEMTTSITGHGDPDPRHIRPRRPIDPAHPGARAAPVNEARCAPGVLPHPHPNSIVIFVSP